jgi:hypothetical protein
MRKEILIHFSFLILLFVLISLVRNYLNLSYWPFWVGGLVGTLLPDLDHLLYVFFLRPEELTSQRVNYMLEKRNLWGSLNLLAETRSERTKLVFHTALFQIIFVILSFWMVTSSGSFFGRGVVLAFLLHLIVDQTVDLKVVGNLFNWFKNFPIAFPQEREKLYWGINILVLVILAFLF